MRLGMYVDLRNPPDWRRPWAEHYEKWLEIIAEGERLGAPSVWLTEHHFFDDGYLPQTLTFAAAIAARTKRIRIGTAVLLLPLHAAIEVAEQAAVVDILSNGRLDLGMGVGYRKPEFLAFAGEFKRRYGVFADRVREMRQLWGEEEGAEREITPAPVQRPLPLWFGFGGPQGARLAGRLGGGLLSLSPSLLKPYVEGLEKSGHGADTARMIGGVEYLLADDPEGAWERAKHHVAYRWDSYNRYMFEGTSQPAPPPVDVESWRETGRFLIGTPEEIASSIKQRVAGLPVEEVYVWTTFPGMPDDLVERHLELSYTRLAPLLAEA